MLISFIELIIQQQQQQQQQQQPPTMSTGPSSSTQNTRVLVAGIKESREDDYYCHKQLGGCGTVFTTANAPVVTKDYDGDIIESYILCPICERKIQVYTSSYQGKRLEYRRILANKK
jgi:hypothetical protein